MITRLLYFRPDRRFVNDEDLHKKYTCLIRDEFTTAENHITLPVYLTVFQHHVPKTSRKAAKTQRDRDKKPPSSYKFLEKICFYLVGSKQAPLLTELSAVQNVDRIEFKGHIGFELPIFEIISQLPALRKVSFFISPCKQGNFVSNCTSDSHNRKDGQLKASSSNLLVTNVKMIFEKCANTSCCCKTAKIHETDFHQEHFTDALQHDVSTLKSDKKEILRIMIVRLLEKMVKQCPNIKHLCMEVPSYKGVKEVIESCITQLDSLKPTHVSCTNDNIFVRKRKEDDIVSSNNDHNLSTEITTLNDIDKDLKLEPVESNGSKQHEVENTEDKQNTVPDEPESTPCLFDMSKLLGSMLGIPTSSLPPGSASQSSITSSSSYQSSTSSLNGSSTPEPQTLNDFQPVSSSTSTTGTTTELATVAAASICPMNSTVNNSQRPVTTPIATVEVITYAAAAASAAATPTTPTTNINNHHRNHHHHHNSIRVGGNDNGGHHHRHRHFNEGSRRSFSRDGEVPLAANEDELNRNKNKKKPSVPHVADLGKPVLVSSSSSSKSPHKRVSINNM